MRHEFVLRYTNNVWYGVFSHLAAAGFKHGFSTKFGGYSQNTYESLNMALHVGDDPQTVVKNRKQFFQAVMLEADNLVTAKQVHDTKILAVDQTHMGRGANSYADAIEGTDALLTDREGIPLVLFFADCTPVFIADPVKKVVAIVHAGWKGTVGKIAQKTVEKMSQVYGTKPKDCLVGIGPAIGPCCYEVDTPVIDALKGQFNDWEELIESKNNKYYFNMWETNKRQLTDIGVVNSNIVIGDVCTKCHSNIFFSYRADHGITGRMGAFITL